MITHIYPHFLDNLGDYSKVEQYWVDLWQQIEPSTRQGWHQPWFQPLPPGISEGNPIFSAVSPTAKRAIRIIQFEPTENALEFIAYPDTFGGTFFDPKAIHELVISCALSDMAAMLARSLMRSWVEGKGLMADLNDAGLVLSNNFTAERVYDTSLFNHIKTTVNDRATGEETYDNSLLGRVA